jgi:hypothetical protein
MKNDPLKVRASRLRSAIKEVLGQKISISQSLELVAKEEDYDNWDQASALYSQRILPANSAMYPVYSSLRLLRKKTPDKHERSVQGIFNKNKETLHTVQKLFNFQATHGALIIIAGSTYSGKTSTLHAIIKDSCRMNWAHENIIDIYHVGIVEEKYPKNVRLSCEDELSITQAQQGLPHKYIVIEEVRNEHFQCNIESLYAALLLVKKGHKVIFTHQSKGCSESIASLSKSLAKIPHEKNETADSLLEELLAAGHVHVIHQQISDERVHTIEVTIETKIPEFKHTLDMCLRSNPDTIEILLDNQISEDTIHGMKEIGRNISFRHNIQVEFKYADGTLSPLLWL